MKKTIVVMLSVLLVLSLIGCDDVVDMMGKMGQSVAGIDMSVVGEATNVTKVDQDAVAEVLPQEEDPAKLDALESKTSVGEVQSAYGINFFGNEYEDMVSIVNGESGSVILVGDTEIELSGEVTSILPPADLSGAVSALTGAAKEAAVEELSKPVSDEATVEAAKGTATIVYSLLDKAVTSDAKDEGMQEFLDALETMATDPEYEITGADVLILQAATNMVADISDTVASVVDDAGELAELNSEQLMGTLSDSMESASTLITVISTASSGSAMGTSFLSMLNGLIK